MSGISTHVLDTAAGRPAVGIGVHLWRDGSKIGSVVTDANGRGSGLIPAGTALSNGVYQLVFDVAQYFPHGFYPEISITFRVTDIDSNYHVPLLLSAFGFTTYRGS